MKKFISFIFVFAGGALLSIGVVVASNAWLGTTLIWWMTLPGCFIGAFISVCKEEI